MLIKCRECGKEISDQAEMCPHCGTPYVVKGEPVDEVTQTVAPSNGEQQYAQQPQPQQPQPHQYQQPQQPYYPPQQGGSGNGLLYLIIGLLAAGLIGLGLYVFLGQKNDTQEQTGKEAAKVETPTTATTEKTEELEKPAPQVEKVIVAVPEKEPTDYPQGHFALTGSISNYDCHIDLDLSGNEATGSYYYTKNGSANRLYLTGEVNGQHVELHEYNSDGDQTGYFNGMFNGITYEGTFINYKSQVMAFKFFAK